MKKGTIRDIATSFTTTIFLVIGISGTMMFFHFYDSSVKELHEILGLVFVGAALFHVIMNWKSMKNYFSKKIFISATIIIALVSGIFISQNLNKGDNPKGLLMEKVLNAPISDSFKLLNGNYDEAIKKLASQNIITLDNKTISAIAKANKTSPFKIVAIIVNK
ncbi:MAG: hypothetical protein C0625_10865 [Arcobacter sp.]|mgnify:CR=1 FL=1|nr:MAG: hypothetical protein C0625_10865 [Arcobacter sp.]